MMPTDLDDPFARANLVACLSMIRACEGTADRFGYHALFGHTAANPRTFLSMDDHPRLAFLETRDEFVRDGRTQYTTAAGAYQITESTWDDSQRYRDQLGLPPSKFDEDGQDWCAINWCIDRKHGALGDVLAGRLPDALARLRSEWASLPTATGVQGHRTYAFAAEAFEAAGGVIA